MEVDLDWVLLGRGGSSSGVWLKRFTKSFKEVCRFRAVFEIAGFDLAVLRGDFSAGDEGGYLEV